MKQDTSSASIISPEFVSTTSCKNINLFIYIHLYLALNYYLPTVNSVPVAAQNFLICFNLLYLSALLSSSYN